MHRFYKLLYKQGEIVEVRILPVKTDNGTYPKSFYFQQNDKLISNIQNIIKSKNKEYNIYFGALPRKKHGEMSQISRINTCFVDIDKKSFNSEEEFNKHILTLEKRILPSVKLNYTAKVFTGNGYHYYFIFSPDELILPDAWKEIQEALIEFCHGDKQVKDLPRILRIPSSINIKDPQNPKNCKLVDLNEKNLLSISHFDALLSRYKKFKEREEKEKEAARNYKTYSGDKKDFVSAVLQVLQEEGAGIFTDRKDYLRFCFACKDAGIQYEQIDPILCQSDNYNYDKNLKEYEKLKPSKVDFGTAYYFAERVNSTKLKELLGGSQGGHTGTKKKSQKHEEIPFPTDNELPPEKKDIELIQKPDEQKPQGLKVFSAYELGERKLEPIKYIIPGILPEGLAILAGRPKIGKSWMGLNFALSIANGDPVLGTIDVKKRTVLYVALEDGERRLQSRIQNIEKSKGFPKNLYFSLQMKNLLKGGFEELEQTLDALPDVEFVLIDTYAKIKNSTRGNAYEEDYKTSGRLQSITTNKKITILLVHHLRKMVSTDFIESVSGSTGFTGAADTTIVLDRLRNESDAIMKITGRDIEEQELAVVFDKESTTWKLVGEASYYQLSKERKEIIDLLKEEDRPMSVKEVSELLDKPFNSINNKMWKMSKDRILFCVSKGKYMVSNNIGNVAMSAMGQYEQCSNVSNIAGTLPGSAMLGTDPLQAFADSTLPNCLIATHTKKFASSDLLREYKLKYNAYVKKRKMLVAELNSNPNDTSRLAAELEILHLSMERTLGDIKYGYSYSPEEQQNGFLIQEQEALI